MKRNKPSIILERRYGIKEVCDMLMISRETVRRYTNAEVIVPIVISRWEVYYLGSEVEILYNALTGNHHAKD